MVFLVGTLLANTCVDEQSQTLSPGKLRLLCRNREESIRPGAGCKEEVTREIE
jgi:hypothetical protein